MRRPLAWLVACLPACESTREVEPTEVVADPPVPPPAIAFRRLAIEPRDLPTAARRTLHLTGVAKIEETLPEGARVSVRIACAAEDYVLADIQPLRAEYSKLDRYRPGDTVDVTAKLFPGGAAGKLIPCQLDLFLDRPTATKLASACWRGDEVTDGPCAPAQLPTPDDTTRPLAVHDFVVHGGGTLDVTYMVRINDASHPRAELGLEAACDNFGLPSRVIGRDVVAPELYAAGQSVLRTATFAFLTSKYGVGAGGSPCDFRLWTRTKAEPAKLVLGEWCGRDGVVANGPCREDVPGPAATPVDRDSLTMPTARLVVDGPRNGEGPFVHIESFVRQEKPMVERVTVRAKVTCKLGDEPVVDTAKLEGFDPNDLRPGESTNLTGNAFFETRLAGRPQWCEATFVVGKAAAPTLEIDTWCLRATTTQRGACEAK